MYISSAERSRRVKASLRSNALDIDGKGEGEGGAYAARSPPDLAAPVSPAAMALAVVERRR